MADPAVEFEPPDRAPDAGTHRGVDAVRELLQALFEAWSDLRWEPERRFKVFPEREKALEAAGLSEQDAYADS